MQIHVGRMAAALAVAVALAGCAKASLAPATGTPLTGHGHDAAAHDELAEGRAEGLDPDDGFTFPSQPTPPRRTGRWLTFSNHNHSTYWDGLLPLTVMQQQAYLKGLDAMALTDHDTMRGTASPEFLDPPRGLAMVKGMEWNGFRERGDAVLGHAGLLGMQGLDPIPTSFSLDQMLAEATRREATIVINHPFTRNNLWAQPKPDARAHAVEVWNG